MDILRNTNSVWTGDSLKAYQEKIKSTQDATALPLDPERNKTADETNKNTDTVSISEEARTKQKESSESAAETTDQAQASGTKAASGDDDSTDPIQVLKKQIQQVEKQLRDAQERLVEAMSTHKANSSKDKEQAPEEANGQVDAGDAATIESPENSEDPTVKTIQAEISQLSTTLATLNGQLTKLQQKGGVSGTTGSAGINEGDGLSGGMGERLPVHA